MTGRSERVLLAAQSSKASERLELRRERIEQPLEVTEQIHGEPGVGTHHLADRPPLLIDDVEVVREGALDQE